VLSLTAYDRHVEQLFEVLTRLSSALTQAGIPYRIIGGLAVFLHVEERDPLAARLTRDVDVAVDRENLDDVIEAVRSFGFSYRHAAGLDMLVDNQSPGTRSAVHLLFIREKVRPVYLEPLPDFSRPPVLAGGALVAPVADLLRMKLTSFRLKDRVHIQDLDSVGLITPEIEAELSEPLRQRLAEVRATE
jgi:hypothetical protein